MNKYTRNMKYKICLILPYYGVFPNYFHLWIKSASYNSFIDFYIITDSDFPYQLPDNIYVKNISLNEIQQRLKEKTKKKVIKLSTPYKLCDYKPSYGLIFEDIVCNYDYWGWCDPDIIFGNLQLIVNESSLEQYDVIGGAGAFTICKNTEFLKRCFLYTTPTMPSFSFNEVRTTKKNLIFDEWGATNIRKYLKIKETSQYEWLYKKVLDIIPPDRKSQHNPMFIRFCNYPIIAKYENGHIFAYTISPNGIENIQEYAYCHLQKRKINIITQQVDAFLLYNEIFLPIQMLNECIYNTQNFISKQYQHNPTINRKAWGGVKLLYIKKISSKAIIPIFLRLLRHIGIYPRYRI